MSSVTTTATLTSASGREGTCVVASVGHAYFHRRRRRARCLSSFALHTHATRSLATLSLRSNTHLCTCVLIYFGGRAGERGRGVKLLTRGGEGRREGRSHANYRLHCTSIFVICRCRSSNQPLFPQEQFFSLLPFLSFALFLREGMKGSACLLIGGAAWRQSRIA